MTELASNFTTIFLDFFFLFTPIFFKLFLFKFADKEEATGYSRRLFLSYRLNCSRKKNRKVGEPAKNVFFPGNNNGVFFLGPKFFSRGFVRSFFFSFLPFF